MARPKPLPEGPLVLHVERRGFARFIPPRQARLVLRRDGLAGVVEGNLVLEWHDVGEGGFKALLGHPVRAGELLSAAVKYPPYDAYFPVQARVRYVRPSESRRGAFVAGFSFVDPPPLLLSCIRGTMSEYLAPPRSSRLRRSPPK